MSRRHTLVRIAQAAGAALAMAALHPPAWAQVPQQGVVQILVGFAPGGGVDNVARVLAQGLGETLGQTVVVVNRPGAGGAIAAAALKAAPADGRTLMLANDHVAAILPLTLKRPVYDTATDFRPVGLVSNNSALGLAANGATGVRDFQQLRARAWAKAAPTNIGVGAPGGIPEFAVHVLRRETGVDATAVAYRGGAQMVADLLGGQLDYGISGITELAPLHRDARVRVLAVSGSTRSPLLPDVPTFAELGIKGFEMASLAGFYVHARTTDDMTARLSRALRSTLENPAVLKRLVDVGIYARYGTPVEQAQQVEAIRRTWAPVIREIGFSME